MTNLRREAQGEPCAVREPGVCNFDPSTTVLAHWREIGISGLGLKAPDVLAAHACSACHDFIDGRSCPAATREQRELAHLRAIMRTQARLIKRGILRW